MRYTLYMIKTTHSKQFDGSRVSTTFRLDTHSTHMAIVIVAKNGQSAQNEHGGFTCLHVGKPAYIKRLWKDL